MKIIFITQNFPPEPRDLHLDFALLLKKMGHDVTVVTGFPNWPGGKIYPGYKQKLFQIEYQSDLKIIRLPIYANHDKGGLKRMLNQSTLAFSFLIAGLFMPRTNYYHVMQNPLIVLVCRFLAIFNRAKVTMEIQDLWPDTFISIGVPLSGKSINILDKLCKLSYSACHRIRVTSYGFKEKLVSRGVLDQKIHVIYNWRTSVNASNTDNLINDSVHLRDFNILYAGSVGPAQNLIVFVKAAEMLSHVKEISFTIAGDGIQSQYLQQTVKTMGLCNFKFTGKLSTTELKKEYERCSALLIHLAANPLFDITIPSKISEYLQLKRPILAGVRGELAEILRKSDVGLIFEPDNPEQMAEAIYSLYQEAPHIINDYSQNSDLLFNSMFSEHAAEQLLEDFFA